MSDHSISIVPKRSNYPDAEVKAHEILQWLISQDIVQSLPSDCVLGVDKGFAVSAGAIHVTTLPQLLPYDLLTNGLEVVTTRTAFDPGGNGIEACLCPRCLVDISPEGLDFLGEWFEGEGDNVTCPCCHEVSSVQQFQFSPEWGFSNLGFTFWNWPELSEAFLQAMRERLDCEVAVVYQSI